MKTDQRTRIQKLAFGAAVVGAAGFLQVKALEFHRTTAPAPQTTEAATAKGRSAGVVESRSLPSSTADELTRELERSVQAAELSLRDAREALRSLDANARKPYDNLKAEIAVAGAHLRQSLNAARTASPEQWESALARFAADYDAYVQLIAQAQRAAAGAAGDRP